MKALTIKQPWASLVVAGIKTIENRSWRANVVRGERILIHAGKAIESDVVCLRRYAHLWKGALETLPTGVILGSVRVVEFVADHPSFFFTGPVGWVLEDAREFEFGVAHRGAQGLWTPTPDALELVRRLEEM